MAFQRISQEDKVKRNMDLSPASSGWTTFAWALCGSTTGLRDRSFLADGLTFTNHHVGAVCVQQLSTHGHDYIKEGFYAKTQAEEARCPDLELNELVGIEDVTSKIKVRPKPEMSSLRKLGKLSGLRCRITEKECAASTGLRCDVVMFYSGEVYNLYKYKKYTDVRLVFAPEFDIAFFGVIPTTFTYPRYDLDITFFRVYENDKPAHIEHYLRWSQAGVKEN